jgi:oxygen-independent coproporphyrinogen-3 oxidase
MDFGLYLHLPWCRIKCGYCDFFSLPTDDDGRVTQQGLGLLELVSHALEQPPWNDGRILSIYVGGGTPSLLPASFFGSLLELCSKRLSHDAEISVEMNPETLSPDWLKQLVSFGVNRASLGLQSHRPERLAQLDRIHRPEQAQRAIEWVRQAGFPAFGLDLIYQMVGQSSAELAGETARLLAEEPDHISAYGLTIEPGTRLHARAAAGEVLTLDADDAALRFQELRDCLQEAGYIHYEISNFARPARAARHNTLYWLEEPVLGLGPSAVSSWTGKDGHRARMRFPADAGLLDFPAAEAWRCTRQEVLLEEDEWTEALYVGLRWLGGLDCEKMTRRFPDRMQALLEACNTAPLASHFEALTATHRQDQAARLFGESITQPWLPKMGEGIGLKAESWLLLDEILARLP